ncbi:BNR/Asp-box repeat-containing protein [Cnuella takakiae]|uniref:BNR/Asp-box repeat-containing protein n=1 Tax=Cnuella takakiae TaxID=1302690 RepID=A0A1M4SYE5_9BACT|nr:sialidase family protein [Cnuella takakiae]SHE37246.1 BNR/Asp-box repeat-containing protein [Cnuella takakiae]
MKKAIYALLLALVVVSGLVFANHDIKNEKSLQPEPKTGKAEIVNIVFKSIDGGQTWQDISKGLPEPVIDVYGVGRNDFFADDNGLWLTTGNGLYNNKPNSKAPFWTKEIFPDEHSNIAHGKAGIFAYNCWGSGIFQKPNGTEVWSPVFTSIQVKRVLSVFETAGGTIFICSDKGLFKSTDSGTSWKHAGVMVGKLVESNGVLLTTSQRGILRSTDEGESWELVISEGGVGIDVERIKGGFAAINYSTAAKTRRIRTSYDGGKTWQPIDAGFPGQAIVDSPWRPINAGNLRQGTDSLWHPKEVASPAPEYKTSIIQVGENFFCGHSDGIYRTSDKGKTWKLVLPSVKGKMFKLSVSGNVLYAIQIENHC